MVRWGCSELGLKAGASARVDALRGEASSIGVGAVMKWAGCWWTELQGKDQLMWAQRRELQPEDPPLNPIWFNGGSWTPIYPFSWSHHF